VSVNVVVETGHFVLPTVLRNVGGFIIFTELLGGVSNILLSVRVKEPVGSGLDHSGYKFVTALPLSILIRHKHSVLAAPNARGNLESLIVLSFFNHLNFFIRIHSGCVGFLFYVVIFTSTRVWWLFCFSFGVSLLSHGDSQPNESLLSGVAFNFLSNIFIESFRVLLNDNSSSVSDDSSLRNVLKDNFLVDCINFETLLVFLHLFDDLSRDSPGDK
jgi:hypothetical protein